MKLLMIYCKTFTYIPTLKTLEDVPDDISSGDYKDIQVAFIQAEAEDEEQEKEVEKKLIKNLKWICGKNQSKAIVLHSFAHLSESKANPEFTREFFNKVQARMENAGYLVYQTPFGYFLDLKVDAPGFSLARVFKSF